MLSVVVRKQRGNFLLNLAFEAPLPGVIALFGRSGCGKSTAIDVLAGLLRPDTGRIVLNGEVLLDSAAGISVAAERRGFGYVFQDARLFPHLSVRSNLRYAARRARVAAFVRLEEVIGLLDLESLLHRHPRQLSGGERQRVAIGRALLCQPRLMLLDEPLAALDAARRAEVLPYLERLRDHFGIPMVYVTHDYDEVLRLATHLVLIENGSVVGAGRVGEMSLDPHLRALIGREEVGAIIDGTVLGTEPAGGLTQVRVGGGELMVRLPGPVPAGGAALRVQLLARDIIVSTRSPEHLSVRNNLQGVIVDIEDDGGDTHLVGIDIGGARILARITQAATRELELRPGRSVWALVKSVSLRRYALPSAISAGPATSAASRGA